MMMMSRYFIYKLRVLPTRVWKTGACLSLVTDTGNSSHSYDNKGTRTKILVALLSFKSNSSHPATGPAFLRVQSGALECGWCF